MEGLFFLRDISLVIIAATIFAMIAGKLKQPLILGYVLAGALILPLNLLTDSESIKIISDLGIAFLLFIIGLELDFNSIRQVGIKSTIIGLLQVLVTAAAGFAISLLILKLDIITSIYIAIIISFSSTMIVAKLLGEQKELESLHGELVLVMLIIQDIIAVIALSIIKTGSTASGMGTLAIGILILKGLALLTASYILYRILPFFLKEAVYSPELIFISSLTTMFLFSALANFLGFSFSIGAFIAGIALSTSRFRHEITGRVKPLKDFFLVLLFVTLGMQLVLNGLQKVIVPLVVLFAAVIIIKPILIFLIVKKFGYGNRTAFFTGIQLAQVGEFSLVLASEGLVLGQIDNSIFSMLIILTIATMILSTYMIKYDDLLYEKIFSRLLNRLGNSPTKEEHHIKQEMKGHIIIFGLHRMSEKIIHELKKRKKKFIVVDYNPEKIKILAQKKIDCICSDMTNPEVYEQLNLKEAKTVISTVHNFPANTTIIGKVKQENPKAILMVASNSEEEALRLYEYGADFVIIPLLLGGAKVADYLKFLEPEEIAKWGKRYYRELKEYNRPKTAN